VTGEPSGSAEVDDAEIQALRLVEDGETRRPVQHDAAVALILLAGDEGMHRRGEPERGGIGGHVGDHAVGDEDGAGHLLGGYIIDQLGQRREQGGTVAVCLFRGAHLTHLKAAQGR
jgi:hypothetical protein